MSQMNHVSIRPKELLNRKVSVVLTQAEYDELKAMSVKYGVTVSDVVRSFLNDGEQVKQQFENLIGAMELKIKDLNDYVEILADSDAEWRARQENYDRRFEMLEAKINKIKAAYQAAHKQVEQS